MAEPKCVIHFDSIKSSVLTDLTQAKVDKLLQILPKWADSNKSPENSVAKLALDSNLLSTTSQCHASCYLRISSESKLNRALSSYRKGQVITMCIYLLVIYDINLV